MNLDLNPLSVLKERQLKRMPIHFSKTKIGKDLFLDDSLWRWIESKLKGRYCVSQLPTIEDNKTTISTFVGFEEEKELTYFLLAYPKLRRF